jgi:hypothetical protein
MPKPMIRIHNVETGEIIDREMNAAEIKAHDADVSALKALEDANAAKSTAKAALLERLGISAQEAALLLS